MWVLDFRRENETNVYYPVIYFNDFWSLKENYMPINESVRTLSMHLNVGPLSLLKWQLMLQFEESLKMQKNFMASTTASPGEEFKVMLLNTNPYLLILTFVVTILHSVLDFMAFKNGT
jgi:hypothetical protein